MFVACVSCARYDDTLRVFVRSGWFRNLYLRAHSIFALVDTIGVKDALRRNSLTREKLVLLRDRIDVVARAYPTISFISFADSLLLKSNWSAGLHDSQSCSLWCHEIRELERFARDCGAIPRKTYRIETAWRREVNSNCRYRILELPYDSSR
jgi:hypothetical protein